MLESHSHISVIFDFFFFLSDHCCFTRNILKHFVCLGFPTLSPRFATKCMILNKEQLSLTWLYFLIPQGGCESGLTFLKHFAWKIIAAAYRFACYFFSFWLMMHFCAPCLLCVCHCTVLAFTEMCFIPRTLSENRGQVHTQSWIPKRIRSQLHTLCFKCSWNPFAAVHGLMCFSEE